MCIVSLLTVDSVTRLGFVKLCYKAEVAHATLCAYSGPLRPWVYSRGLFVTVV